MHFETKVYFHSLLVMFVVVYMISYPGFALLNLSIMCFYLLIVFFFVVVVLGIELRCT